MSAKTFDEVQIGDTTALDLLKKVLSEHQITIPPQAEHKVGVLLHEIYDEGKWNCGCSSWDWNED